MRYLLLPLLLLTACHSDTSSSCKTAAFAATAYMQAKDEAADCLAICLFGTPGTDPFEHTATKHYDEAYCPQCLEVRQQVTHWEDTYQDALKECK